jgi:hypothetical protein
MRTPSFTRAELAQELHYDPITGIFTRLTARRGHQVGKVVGFVNADGYVIITVFGRTFKAHHLAWFYQTGMWREFLDHEDTDRANNAFGNLREATRAQNAQNKRLARTTASVSRASLPRGRSSALRSKSTGRRSISAFSTR